ncbi:MAG: hypothetical protein FJY10_11495 [Bacteroidetes bacterium]|nr:hypothetical protein [Bacteroidota bacterium]
MKKILVLFLILLFGGPSLIFTSCSSNERVSCHYMSNKKIHGNRNKNNYGILKSKKYRAIKKEYVINNKRK